MVSPINRMVKSNILDYEEALLLCWKNSIYSLATWPVVLSLEHVHPRKAIGVGVLHGCVLLCLQQGSSSSYTHCFGLQGEVIGFFIVCSYVETIPHGIDCHFIPGALHRDWMGLIRSIESACQFVFGGAKR